MKIRAPHTALAVLFLAACSSPSEPVPTVAEVRVSPEGNTIEVGLTVQFSAQALDANGQTISGLPVSWSSSNTSVATIDTNGLASALTTGFSAITATIGGVSDSEVLNVEPSQCTNRIDVILAPGEFQTYDGAQCLLLPSGQSGDRYRVAVVRITQIADSLDVPIVTLRLDPVLTATAAPIAVPPQVAAPAAVPAASTPLEGIDGTRILQDVERMRGTRRYHQQLRERERAFRSAWGPALPDRRVEGPLLTSHPDPPQRADMYLDLECNGAALRPVRLIDFNADIAIYQDSVQWAVSPLTTAATQPILSYYANYARDMITQYFGTPSDIDGNGRIIVVTTPEIPETAAAAVFSGDFQAGCTSSNQAEVVYYAADVISSVADANPSYLALSVLAHEAKHVVSIYNGVQRGGFHDTWMEEGRAEIAQVMSSRIAWAATGGPAVNAVLNGNHIVQAAQNNGGSPTPEMWGVVGAVAEIIGNYSQQPNSLITDPVGSAGIHSFYASSFHLHRFVGDHYGTAASAPRADSALFRGLTAQGAPAGYNGLAQQTGKSFEQLLEEVVVAMATHRAVTHTLPNFTTWDLRSSTDVFASPAEVTPPGLYPWPITTDPGGNPDKGFVSAVYSCGPKIQGSGANATWVAPAADDRCAIGPSGVRFHDFRSSGVGLGAQVRVEGARQGKIIVVRLF